MKAETEEEARRAVPKKRRKDLGFGLDRGEAGQGGVAMETQGEKGAAMKEACGRRLEGWPKEGTRRGGGKQG